MARDRPSLPELQPAPDLPRKTRWRRRAERYAEPDLTEVLRRIDESRERLAQPVFTLDDIWDSRRRGR
jgi:hypothetical protein